MSRKTNIRWHLMLLGAVALLLCATAVPAAAGAKSKPMVPVQVTIEPTTAKMKPKDIRPGDVVEFRVSARAVRGADEVRVDITLLDGAELVAGDLNWAGKLSGNEAKQLVISVRAPSTGVGRVMAAVSAVRDGKVVMTKQSIYTLGANAGAEKGKPAPKTRRDSKGREVVEY